MHKKNTKFNQKKEKITKSADRRHLDIAIKDRTEKNQVQKTHITRDARPEQLLYVIHDGLPPLFGDHRRPDTPQDLSSGLLGPSPVLGPDHRGVGIRLLQLRPRRVVPPSRVAVVQRRPRLQISHSKTNSIRNTHAVPSLLTDGDSKRRKGQGDRPTDGRN